MNCTREDCGHAKSLHSEQVEGAGRCWGCACPEYADRIDPSPAAGVQDFDHGDDDGNPGL